MSSMTRDAAFTALITIAWVTTTLGLATSDTALTAASVPPLAVSLVLHVVGSRRRTPAVEDARRLSGQSPRAAR